jgi:hypothetical protein
MLTKRIRIRIKLKEKKMFSFTVPNPVLGIEKANGAVFVVFSGETVGAGILKLKPVDSVESLPAVVVVVGFGKLNNGKDELVGGRIGIEGVVD